MLSHLSVIDLQDPREIHRLVPHLDIYGFRRIWLTEHRTPGQSASPIVLSAVAAAVGKTIRVGTAGIKLRYYNALKVAEDFSLLEALYPGRIDIGVLGQKEFDQDTDTALSASSTNDGEWYEPKIAHLRSLLSGRSSAPKLRSVRASTVPPIWVCSIDHRSAAIAGRQSSKFAYSLFVPQSHGLLTDPDVIASYVQSYRGAGAPEAVVVCFGACAETSAGAARAWRRAFGIPSTEVVAINGGLVAGGKPSPNFLGNPTECYEQLSQFATQFSVSEIVVHCFAENFEEKRLSYDLISGATRDSRNSLEV